MTSSKKREDYLSWDESFMGIAQLIAGRSKDPSSQVGACIVSKDNRVLSLGYNGAPNDYPDDDFNWGREGDFCETKYAYVVHSELNALLNFRGDNKAFQGAKVYVTLFPCNECAKALIQAGIKEVIYLEDKYRDTDICKVSRKLFDTTGVKYRQYKSEKNKVLELKL